MDAKQLKSSLATLISKWSYKFLEHLLQKVEREAADITDFVNNVDVKLDIEVDGQVKLLKIQISLKSAKKSRIYARVVNHAGSTSTVVPRIGLWYVSSIILELLRNDSLYVENIFRVYLNILARTKVIISQKVH